MTREEVIKWLKDMLKNVDLPMEQYQTALEMVIKLVEQEPCEDCISKQAVLDMQYRIDDSATLSTRDVVNVDDIEDLSPITLQPKTGHWIMHDNHRECSKCKVWLPKDMPRNSYCPNCGAKMSEVSE